MFCGRIYEKIWEMGAIIQNCYTQAVVVKTSVPYRQQRWNGTVLIVPTISTMYTKWRWFALWVTKV